MSVDMQIALRANERFYINGAVLRVDRKVRFELLNDATFIIGAHVMQLEQATTPLRQLYFLIQGMLMEPAAAPSLRPAIDTFIHHFAADFCKPVHVRALNALPQLLSVGNVFEALKSVRTLIALDDAVAVASEAVQEATT